MITERCRICSKAISKKEVEIARKKFPKYEGQIGWICDDCWANEAEFYIGIGIRLPDWCHDLLRKVRSK